MRLWGPWPLVLWLALGGCGAAAPGHSRHGSARGDGPTFGSGTPEWTLQRCGLPDAVALEVEHTDELVRVVHGSDRIELSERGGRRAVEVPIDPIGAAARLGDHWYFWTAGGVILRADDFLGSLTLVASAPRAAIEPVPAEGALVVRLAGTAYWLFEPEGGARPLPVPPDARALSAAVRWPDVLAVLVEPGALVVSHDRGETFAQLDVGPHAVVALGMDGGRIWLDLGDETLELGEADALRPMPRPSRRAEDAYPGRTPLDLRVAAFLAPTDGWCDRRTPLELTPSASGTIAPSEDELEGDCTLSSGVDTGPLLAVCRAEEGGSELRRWDPESAAWSAIGELGQDPLGCTFVGASGSPSFVIDVFGSRRFYDGSTFTPLSLDSSALLSAVSGDLAFARGPIGDDYGIFVVRLPSGDPVPLELPSEGRTIVHGEFAGDGTLALHTRDASDRHYAILGAPGAWSVHALPDHVADVAWATRERGMADADGALFTTDDAGEHWERSDVASAGATGPLRCSRDGCVLPGVAMLRSPAVDGERVRVETRSDAALEPHAASGEQAQRTRYWHCEWPRTTRWPDASDVSVGAGWVSGSDAGRGATVPIAWAGVDSRGAFRTTGAIAAGYDRSATPIVITRSFVVTRTEDGLAVGAARAHALDHHLTDGLERPTIAAMALDEGALLAVRAENRDASEVERTVRLDGEGEIAAARAYLWAEPREERAWFTGADGQLGRAVWRDDAQAWTLYPMDGSAAIRLRAPRDATTACGADAGPWTLVPDVARVLLEARGVARVGSDTTTNVLRVGEGRACVAAVAQPMREPEAIGFAFATRGRIHALALDLEGHTSPMRCADDAPHARERE